MTVASPDRLRRDLVELLNRGADMHEFSLRATRILGRAVPFDGVCMLTLDPATFLPTSEVSENGLPMQVRPRMAQIEIGVGDVNTFQWLIRSGRSAESLSHATDGDLDVSLRHRELRAPYGFGDELRAVLSSESVTWGGLSLLRGSDHRPFTPADAALVASLSRHLAEGVRRAILLTALSARRHEDEGEAGLVLLAADHSILVTDAAAERWLAELATGTPDARVPHVIAAVASRAGSVADGGEPLLARARVRTPSGAWLVVRGSALSGDGDARTAVTIEPARAHDLAPLVAAAYELTERERAITQLVAQGLATDAIAGRLHISPWTVQDHLKSIFEKVGVSARGELIARIFFEHYAPRLSERAPVDRNGWFERSPSITQDPGIAGGAPPTQPS